MTTVLPARPTKNDWQPRKVRIADLAMTVYRWETQGDNYALQLRNGREAVTICCRPTPAGGFAFMLANYAGAKRRFDCHPTEEAALEAADQLARKLSERQVVAACLTKEQASDFASANLKSEALRQSCPLHRLARKAMADSGRHVAERFPVERALEVVALAHGDA